MHGIGDHVTAEHGPVAHKSWIIVMGVCARRNTVIASDAPLEVDHHRLLAIYVAIFDQELGKLSINMR